MVTIPPVDLHHVPPEMPMYLLQEDEGNDEEIMRLLSTQPLAFSQAVALVTTSAQTDTMTMESSQVIFGSLGIIISCCHGNSGCSGNT